MSPTPAPSDAEFEFPRQQPPGPRRLADAEWVGAMLRRRWWVIVVVALACGAAATAFSASRPDVYATQAMVRFESPQGQDRLITSDRTAPDSDAQRSVATVRELLEQSSVVDEVVKSLGDGRTRDEIASKVEITANSSSDLVSVRATGSTPEAAERLANVYAQTFVDSKVDEVRDQTYRAIEVLEKRLDGASDATRREVREQISQLEALAALGSGSGVTVASVATAESKPVSPKPLRDGILATFLGALLGIGIALLWHRLDDRIREASELEALTGLPIIAQVPRNPSYAHLASDSAELDFASPEFEPHRIAWTQLRFFLGNQRRMVVAITSTAPGEGKTTSAECLAASAALMGHSVVLVDADLRRPALAPRLGVPRLPGLSDVVIGNITLTDALCSVPVTSGPHPAARFDLLPAGTSAAVPSALLASDAFADLVRELSDRYDAVIIDNAPTVVADVMHILRHSDAAVLVARPGAARRKDALAVSRLFAQLPALRAAIIVNALSSSRSSRDGYYGTYEPTPTASDVDRQPSSSPA